MVSTLDRQSRFRGGHELEEETVLDRDAAAEHHRRAYARARVEQHDSGYSRAARADAGVRSALAARNGSRRNRDSNGGREMAAQKRRRLPSRPWAREISPARARMAGQTRRHHH